MRGFLSSKWRALVELEDADTNDVQSGKGNSQMKKISKALFDLSRDLWIARNNMLHGENSLAALQIRSVEVAEMKEFHSNPQDLPAGDRHYCSGSFDSLLSKSPSVRRRWLRHMRMVKARKLRDGVNQTTITSFFQRIPIRNG